jgi:hypothetical protein
MSLGFGARDRLSVRRIMGMRRKWRHGRFHPPIEWEGGKQSVELRSGLGSVQADGLPFAWLHGGSPQPDQMTLASQVGRGHTLGVYALPHFALSNAGRHVEIKFNKKFHDLLLCL